MKTGERKIKRILFYFYLPEYQEFLDVEVYLTEL